MSIQTAMAAVDDGAPITATIVPDEKRLAFMPEHFGSRNTMRAEALLYATMKRLTGNAYAGGYWHYIELSNGGFYMRLNTPRRYRVACEGNFFDDEMSADAASITASLYVINQLLWMGLDHLNEPFYKLRDYAKEHPESALILAAID
jgi:hypothetical protein